MPASSGERSSICPTGPTNGLPARSSLSPGCSPTSITCACCGPSPNTVWVAFFQRGQARQLAASSRRILRLVGDVADAVVMGFFRFRLKNHYGGRGSMRAGCLGSFDPIGIAHEKHRLLTRLTPQAMLALY